MGGALSWLFLKLPAAATQLPQRSLARPRQGWHGGDDGRRMGSAAAPGPCMVGAVIPTAGLPCGEGRIAGMLAGTWNKAGAGPRQLGSSPAFPKGS